MSNSTGHFKWLVLCAVLGAASAGLQAQTIYRIVGADGRVTFSDKPPLDASKATATNASGKPVGATESALPYELRQVVSRYPVTLYTGTPCAPCNSGRMLLQSRGIPFTEYTIGTPEDGEALQRLSGDNSLPFLTIGGQKIKGFSEAEWVQFLNAANYPAVSALPANFRAAPAKPLVTVQKPAAPTAQAQAQAEAPPPAEEKAAASQPSPPPETSPSNPAGIKF